MPPDGSKTSVTQTWDKPRVNGIRPEPVMACSVKKAKVDGDQSSKPIKSSLYEARMENVVPNDPDLLEEVQKTLKQENPLYGINYMARPDMYMEYRRNTLGCFIPLGSVLSYQLSTKKGNFDIHHNLPSLDRFSCTDKCQVEEDFPSLPLDEVQEIKFADVSDAGKVFSQPLCLTKEESVTISGEGNS